MKRALSAAARLALGTVTVVWIGGGLAQATRAASLLVEAESFAEHGGWKLDTQFIEIMGSPYLLAHGLGRPVADATTSVTVPHAGKYRVWVRTKDWVARWNAPGAPGRFQVLINGKPLAETFGTRGAEWFWHDGGTIELPAGEVRLALHDLTGFDGRCDAILLTDDLTLTPPNDPKPMAAWRKQLLGLPDHPLDAGEYDLVVVGGGYAGTCAAVSAARMGCRVALIQDRPVLGGNGSSEIRVWPQGKTRLNKFPRIGEIVEELVDYPSESPAPKSEFNDAKREAIVRAEKNIRLFLNHHVYAVETNDHRITAVIALDTRTSQVRRFRGKLFADCTGHGTVGYLAGADHTVKEKGHMGMSNMWRWENADSPQEFPETLWALPLEMGDFPYPDRFTGRWFWESGFDKHPIQDLEAIRDWNLRAVFGAFNAMKNRGGRDKHRNARLVWVAYIGGNRESRQLLGDVILTGEDVVQKKPFPDGCVPTTWDIDLHYPDPRYAKKFPDNPFISKAEFWRAVDRETGYLVPYRCFYSRNIENLFMAGRCISVTHEALGTVRVMKTGGMMGEVVGKAASLCVLHDRDPRAIYHSHWDELVELLKLPGVARRDTVDGPIYIPPGVEVPPLPKPRSVDPSTLPGLVIDDTHAEFVGSWTSGTGLKGFIGSAYRYHGPGGGAKVRFPFRVEKSGRYEVRFAYQAHPNRASNVRVIVHGADGDHEVRVNERRKPPLEPGFISLGTFTFEADREASVEVLTEGANGFVHADAVQVLPATE